jgi:tetratricopeptide (TPR) repeat protein
MNNLKAYIFIFLLFGVAHIGQAQQTQTKTEAGKQKVIKLNTVKPDTSDPNKKALYKLSKESMFNTTKPPAPQKPEEIKAFGLFSDGSKKGKEGDFYGAIEDFTKSLDLMKSSNTYVKRGYAYMMLGNYGAAISDETEAIKMSPSALPPLFIRGICRYETADYKGAKEDLYLFLDRERTNAIAFNYYAAILFMNQDYKGALENYNEVVRLDPKYPDIYTNRGMMRHYSQDYKGAILDYNEAIKQNPKNSIAYNNRGAAKLMLKDLNSALEDFNQAILLDPAYANAYDNRGRVRHALGDTQGACSDWESAYTKGLSASKDLIIKYCK